MKDAHVCPEANQFVEPPRVDESHDASRNKSRITMFPALAGAAILLAGCTPLSPQPAEDTTANSNELVNGFGQGGAAPYDSNASSTDDETPARDDVDTDNSDQLPQSDKQRLEKSAKQSLQLPEKLVNETATAMSGIIEAGWAAANALGSPMPVSRGTVTLDANNQVQYEEEPADRQLVNLPDGTSVEILLDRLESSFQGDFFDNPHTLVGRVHWPERFDLTIDATQIDEPGQFFRDIRTRAVQGTINDDGEEYAVDVESNGTVYFEIDNTGSELLEESVITGTIDSDTGTTSLQDTWRYNLVTVSDSGNTSSASTLRRTSRSSWTTGEHSYSFADLIIIAHFRDGVASDQDNWEADGELLRDGAPYGMISLQTGSTSIRVVASTPEGSVTIAEWSAN